MEYLAEDVGLPLLSRLGKYYPNAGGYSVMVPAGSFDDLNDTLTQLMNIEWVDVLTRAVILEFTVYSTQIFFSFLFFSFFFFGENWLTTPIVKIRILTCFVWCDLPSSFPTLDWHCRPPNFPQESCNSNRGSFPLFFFIYDLIAVVCSYAFVNDRRLWVDVFVLLCFLLMAINFTRLVLKRKLNLKSFWHWLDILIVVGMVRLKKKKHRKSPLYSK
jgi:hypothetical protein